MKQIISRKLLAASVATALSLTAATNISADTITQMTLEDIDGDTAISGFRFTIAATPYAPADNSFPTGLAGTLRFGDGTNDDCGAGPGDCIPLAFATGEIGTNVFSSGFNFGGGGDFQPVIVGSTPTADGTEVANNNGNTGGSVTIDEAGTLVLDLTALDFGGFYNAPTFFLAPQSRADFKRQAGASVLPGDELLSVLGDPAFTGGSSTDLPYYLDTLVDNGDGTYGFIIRWTSKIKQSSTFDGNTSRWRLEGTIAVADAAPLVFIDGASGVAGDFTSAALPDTDPYVDPGAVCQDVIDGTIAPLSDVASLPVPLVAGTFLRTITGLVGSSTGPAGNSLTVTYTCTDSQDNTTTANRTVTVGADTTPPDITLGVAAPELGRNDSVDGATVDILVGGNYVDAGATCNDLLDGQISMGANFSVNPDPAVVDTSIASTGTIIAFSCDDAAMNGPTVVNRTVNVLEDTIKPVITLERPDPITIGLDETFIVPLLPPAVTCTDANPVDADPIAIDNNLNVSPTTVDTSIEGTTNIVYNCSDAAGNAADTVTLEVTVASGQSFQILSMTIADVDGDRLAGCFRFEPANLDPLTCLNSNRFATDSSTIDSLSDPTAATLPGVGTDVDGNGVPVGIIFGQYQSLGAFSPGWNFTNFPFVPFTFNPPSEQGTPPEGLVTVAGAENLLTFQSLPFSGRYTSNQPNDFFLDPDQGTLSVISLTDNNDDDGTTRTFNYLIKWTHRISSAEDPTSAFVGFKAAIRLEGVMTVGSTPVIVNKRPQITGLTVAQDDRGITRTVTQSGGIITATVVANDPDVNDILSFDWSKSPVTAAGPTNEAIFSFEASSLTADSVTTLTVTVSDDKDEPLSATSTLALQVTADAPALSDDNDANGNGIGDATEGFADTDDDGIPDYRDRSDDPTRNSRSFDAPDEGEIVVSVGRLRLGDASFATGRDSFIVTETDLGTFDPLNQVAGITHSGGGIADFEISGLPLGGAVSIVIPQTVALPNVPIYRKFTEDKGWFTFSATSGNELASAKRDVNGDCPDPGSSAYGSTLVEGDECLRLTIVDGSAMDGDATLNGIVLDPGSIASDGPVPVGKAKGPFEGGGCSLSSQPISPYEHFDWAIVAFFIALLGFRAKSKREQSANCR